ncbi:MAG: alanine racemase [Pseudomonadota bacterium]
MDAVTPAMPSSLNANAVLTVDLDALGANYRLLKDKIGGAVCAGVVKANGYGLGSGVVAQRLWREGCRLFFVATIDEAITLRDALGDEAAIATLSAYVRGSEVELIRYNLIPVLNDQEDIRYWRSAARASDRHLPAMIQFDTGMSRLGLPPDQLDAVADDPDAFQGLDVHYTLSHLASADVAGSPQNEEQLTRFTAGYNRLSRHIDQNRASFANSAGIFLGHDYHLDMVRPGIALYGGNPTPHTDNPMQPVVKLTARILQIREIPAGQSVGYGASWTAERPSRIATLGLGYADGFLRTGSNQGHVAFGTLKAPIVGRISMDLTGIDVTDIAPEICRPGDQIEIIGDHRPVDDAATDHMTISYEMLTSLGNRYRRVYETG